MKRKKLRKGFTLVEMILYVSVCSILFLALFGIFSLLMSARIKNQTVTEVNQSGIQITQLVSQSIRNAKGIIVPSIGVSSSTLSLKTVSTSTNPTVFDVASGTFFVKEGTSTKIALSNRRVMISNFTATNTSLTSSTTNEGGVEFSFIVSYIASGSSTDYSFTKSFFGSAVFH